MTDESIFAFVLMPFRKEFDDIYKLGIQETAASLDIDARRLDEQIFQEGMLERIYRQIDAADIVIADMSGQNPNVFYEVGYAHAKEKLCILMTKNADDIPFDLQHRRHIIYGDSIASLKADLTKDLAWAKEQVENIRKSHIQVKVKGMYGSLETTEYFAKGNIIFTVDLLNESKNNSSEIEAIYFYSSSRCSVKQEGKICSFTDSDIPDFDKRHFLTPPVRKMHRNSWSQLNFSVRKHLAYAREGEPIQNSYKVAGRAVLRLVMEAGNFDYEIPVNVECKEYPF